ncbi:MAG TPA: hypothetical protein VF549_13965 [Solirubrobacteraceae bacterium]|jgi:hypothetical protein
MSLVLDRRREVADGPGLHVLLVGVSRYPHLEEGSGPPADSTFGMGQLASPGIAAYRLFQYLEARAHPVAPLATCRLLIAPSEEELAALPELAEADAGPPTLESFLQAAEEWRADAARHRDSVAVAYLAGWGIESTASEQLFLLSDFGNGIGPLFRSAVSLHSLYAGMAPHPWQPDMARTQLFAYDVGRRGVPAEQHHLTLNATAVFDSAPISLDDRAAMTLYAARPGQLPYGVPGQGTFFGDALMLCFDGRGATPVDTPDGTRWDVTIASLAAAMHEQMRVFGERLDLDLDVDVGGAVRDFPLLHLEHAPPVEIVIAAEPGVPHALRDETEEVVWSGEPVAAEGPVRLEVPAGFYRLDVGDRRGRWRLAKPPSATWGATATDERHGA